MKTNVIRKSTNPSREKLTALFVLMFLICEINAQDNQNMKTLLRPDLTISEMWVPEIKINSIQGDYGTLIGFYGGALFNKNLLLGISGGVNLGHPRVNYGYFGGIAQYILHEEKMVHLSFQLLIARGTTKDYENPKNGLLDNFWNISGAVFYLTEPGINVELNLRENLIFITGVSYRFASRLDPDNENVRITHVTNKDMSGININIGLKFGKKSKQALH
jgi:hypothetical protein